MRVATSVLLCVSSFFGCGRIAYDPSAREDASVDLGEDAPLADLGVDAESFDLGVDAELLDLGVDTGSDLGTDAGEDDLGADAGAPLAPGVTVEALAAPTTSEAGASANFGVVLDSPPSAGVTISILSLDTNEGSVSSPSLSFDDANWDTPQTFVVTGVDDFVADGNVLYQVRLSASSSAAIEYAVLTAIDLSLTNIDDDTADVLVTPTTGLITSEDGGSASFTVVLTSRPIAPVVVTFGSDDASEGTVSPAMLSFTDTTWNIPQTVTITGVNDALVDGATAYSIISSDAMSTDPSYDDLIVDDVSVTNVDDDFPDIVVSPTSGLSTTEAGGAAMFSIVLSSEPLDDVTISLTSNTSSEGTVGVPSVTFTTSNWNTPQVVVVTGQNDDFDDGDVIYSIITSATSTDPAYSGFDVDDVSITNLDDDTAGIVISPTAGLRTWEGGASTQVTLILSSRPTANVMIGLSSTNAAEGTVSPASVDIAPGAWNTPVTITLSGVDDTVADGDQTYQILTTPATSSDPSYNGRDAVDLTVINTDDDPIVAGSINSSGTIVGCSGNWEQQLSYTGRYAVFTANTALLPTDHGGTVSAYLLDRATQTLELISTNDAGTAPDTFGSDPTISDDGRFVAFGSTAALVATDTNGIGDIYLRDRQTSTTAIVSVDSLGGVLNGVSSKPHISSDGRYVFFLSAATNAVAGDTNGIDDYFLRDTLGGTTIRVTVSSAGVEANAAGGLGFGGVSTDGRYVTFYSTATNLVAGDTNALADAFVRDTLMGTTTRVSVSTAGAQMTGGAVSFGSAISANGRYVGFASTGTNLVAGDTNGRQDIFIRDLQMSTTTRVSVSSAGVESSGHCSRVFFSSDARYVEFGCGDTNLVAGDTNGFGDIFVRDLMMGTTVRVSDALTGMAANGNSLPTGLSGDGRYAAYMINASNFFPGDVNGLQDVAIARVP